MKEGIFDVNTNGVKTNRDAWVYNFDKIALEENVETLINKPPQQNLWADSGSGSRPSV